MKNWILGLSMVAVLVTGFLLLEKDNEATAARARAEAAERERVAAANAARDSEQRAKQLQSQLREAQGQASERVAETRSSREELIGLATKGREQKNPLLRDPRMRKALESEAKEGSERKIKELLRAGLAQQLNLDEEKSANLFQLLTQRDALFWEKMLMPMMTGEIGEKDMPAEGQKLREALAENKQQLESLLGESGVKTCEWFEKTEAAREEYKRLNARLGEAGQALNEEQQNQLFALLADEHATFKTRLNFEDPAQLDLEHWYNNFTEEKLELCGQDMEALNERLIERSRAVLSEGQVKEFRELLAERMLKARFVVMTTTAMMGKKP